MVQPIHARGFMAWVRRLGLAALASLAAGAAMACPNPGLNGQSLNFSAQQLLNERDFAVTAGGGQDLASCGGVPGNGHVATSPDFTLTLSANLPNRDLVMRVAGQCDTVLLVRGPNGQWHYNDDSNGFDPRVQIGGAPTGEYDIWVGTFGPSLCGSTLFVQTSGGGLQPIPLPQPLPLPLPPLALCPDPGLNGQVVSYDAEQLWVPQSRSVTAGGQIDLASCGGIPGSGRVTLPPDFTLSFNGNPLNRDLEFRVQGQCDTVILVNGPNGQWHFNDDDAGFDPRLRLPSAASGQYDIWVGTYSPGNCAATLVMETFGGTVAPPPPPPPPPPEALCPIASLPGAQTLSLSAQELRTPRDLSITAGGPLDLGACAAVSGNGWIIQSPDLSMNLTANPGNLDLEFRVGAGCDTVLLVNDSRGRWHFADDSVGLDPLIRLPAARTGQYDVWVGTFSPGNCASTLLISTLGEAPPPPPPPPGAQPAPGNMTGYRDRVGLTFEFQLTGAEAGAIWGTGIYTDDSSLARAAVHAGLVQPGQTATVTVEVLPGQDSYSGSLQNGVQSASYGRWNGSYAFVAQATPPAAAGTWQILANGFPGRLALAWDGAAWSGTITFAGLSVDEALTDIFFDPATGEIAFTRPVAGTPQVFRGALTGGMMSGTFSNGSGESVHPWQAMP